MGNLTRQLEWQARQNADPETRIKREWERDAKLREEFGGNFETWAAYRRAELSGSIRRI